MLWLTAAVFLIGLAIGLTVGEQQVSSGANKDYIIPEWPHWLVAEYGN